MTTCCKRIDPRVCAAVTLTLLLLSPLVTATEAPDGLERHLALLPFVNKIYPKQVTADQLGYDNVDSGFEYLPRALTAFLLTDLWCDAQIKLLERAEVEQLVDEIKFDDSGNVELKTKQKLGQAISAAFILTGEIHEDGTGLRASMRLLDLESNREKAISAESKRRSAFDLYNEIWHVLVPKYFGMRMHSEVKLNSNGRSTIAILPFNDNSANCRDPNIGRSLSDVLITRVAGHGLGLVERTRVSELLDELHLSESKYIDEKTALKIGHLLGAQKILFGSLYMENEEARIDVRLTQTESGRIVYCTKKIGKVQNLAELIDGIGEDLIRAIP